MDYKELIDTLRAYRIMTLDRSMIDDALTNAATAIETLLAERDAAVKSLHGQCGECEHHGSDLSRFPCGACSIRGTGLIDRWQWRGQKKGRKGDG